MMHITVCNYVVFDGLVEIKNNKLCWIDSHAINYI